MEQEMAAFEHRPVLLNETIEALRIRPGGTYVDGTIGGGGHAGAILKAAGPAGRLIGIDRDEEALAASEAHLKAYRDRITLVHDTYDHIDAVLEREKIAEVDGILLDLGVSSHQLDAADRGFTYRQDAPLDMRMDRTQVLTARDIVNEYEEAELYRIIRDYGEERFAKNIAKHIVQARQGKPIETTGELTRIIRQSIPMKVQKTGGHPAKRTFQAIRIECNRELEILSDAIDRMIPLLSEGGVLAVISFHSLEDRIVKSKFRENENPCTCPPEFPVCVCGKVSKGKASRKPVLPTEAEQAANSRSKSAKLRYFIKETAAEGAPRIRF